METKPAEPLIRPGSLGETLDAVNAALFYQLPLSAADRSAAAVWIADRQGLPGAYAGMFAPTEQDYAFGSQTFTGEPIRSGAATGHILSEEACRALYRLGVDSPEVRDALEGARKGILRRLADSGPTGDKVGMYCCGQCSVGLWRHLSASGQPDDQRRLDHGLSELRRCRDGEGRWRRFPFYYTLLALTEIDHPAVKEEIHYASAVMERALRRLQKAEPETQPEHDRRRKIVMERLFEYW
jgi:hypothetical protein